jgi:tetratricopeptide (TPR) repeat protein
VKRTERHHLKQDELVHTLETTADWYRANQRVVVNVALVVIGAGLLLGGLYVYRSRQAETARALLGQALEQFHGTVGAAGNEGAASAPDAPHFATDSDRYRAALERFQKIADEFSGYEPGRQARYYEGLCHEGLGDFEAAEKSLQVLRSGGHDLLFYLASKALAAVRVDRADYTGAADLFRSLVEDKDNPLPKDYLLFELAKAEERGGNLDEARRYYDLMVAEHPDSQLRGDAMTRSEALAFQSRSGANGG